MRFCDPVVGSRCLEHCFSGEEGKGVPETTGWNVNADGPSQTERGYEITHRRHKTGSIYVRCSVKGY